MRVGIENQTGYHPVEKRQLGRNKLSGYMEELTFRTNRMTCIGTLPSSDTGLEDRAWAVVRSIWMPAGDRLNLGNHLSYLRRRIANELIGIANR